MIFFSGVQVVVGYNWGGSLFHSGDPVVGIYLKTVSHFSKQMVFNYRKVKSQAATRIKKIKLIFLLIAAILMEML